MKRDGGNYYFSSTHLFYPHIQYNWCRIKSFSFGNCSKPSGCNCSQFAWEGKKWRREVKRIKCWFSKMKNKWKLWSSRVNRMWLCYRRARNRLKILNKSVPKKLKITESKNNNWNKQRMLSVKKVRPNSRLKKKWFSFINSSQMPKRN